MLESAQIVPTSRLDEPCPMRYEQSSPKSEAVNHPSHYNRPAALECIDEMILIFGEEATMNFCLLNSWKYRYRAGSKNGIEDLKKSDWYINKYKELKEKKNPVSVPYTITKTSYSPKERYDVYDYWDGPTYVNTTTGQKL